MPLTQINNTVSDTAKLTANNASFLGGVPAASFAQTASLPAIGVGQTWQDVTSSRANSTTYTNSTGKPIMVHIMMGTTANTTNSSLTVGGIVVSRFSQDDNFTQRSTLSAIVPNGTTYVLTSGGAGIISWVELR